MSKTVENVVEADEAKVAELMQALWAVLDNSTTTEVLAALMIVHAEAYCLSFKDKTVAARSMSNNVNAMADYITRNFESVIQDHHAQSARAAVTDLKGSYEAHLREFERAEFTKEPFTSEVIRNSVLKILELEKRVVELERVINHPASLVTARFAGKSLLLPYQVFSPADKPSLKHVNAMPGVFGR